MKISIITSTYNSVNTLRDTFDSIYGQKNVLLEYIIIDGGSTDGTLDLIKKNRGISKFISEPDQGIYDALNKGIKLATGDIIGFLHSDDVLATNTILAKIVNIFQTKKVDGVYGDLEYVDKKNMNRIIRHWQSKPFTPDLLKKGWMPAHPTLFLKKEIYLNYGDFDLTYKVAADYDFMLRVLKNNSLKFEYLPEVITKMRIGGTSNRNLKNIIQKTKEDYRAITTNKAGNLFSVFRKNISKISQFYTK